MNNQLFKFIENSPTAFHAVDTIKKELSALGFCELTEGDKWKIEVGKSYFVSRNMSSVIAFKVPDSSWNGFMVCAGHCDSPSIRIKENSEVKDKNYVRLSCEGYGGMINSTWLDRPLSIAGKVLVKTEKGIKSILVDFREPVAVIPNVAIHLNRKLNDGAVLNPAVDMVPLYSLNTESSESLNSRVASLLSIDEESILSCELMLYNPQQGISFGGLISAPRLDDLQCVFASLRAFESSKAQGSMPVLAVFDNEEVGSRTKQGADSDFLRTVLTKVSSATGRNLEDAVASSFMLSCDNAHGVHPNHPELSDPNHQPTLGGGVVIKYNSNQQYATDGISSAIVKALCHKAQIPYQYYFNRADIPSGATLGNVSNTQLAMLSADIGLPQLAMHSAFETAGAEDTENMVALLSTFFGSSLKTLSDGEYELN